jgi:ribonucleotide monophosphatase NagD (HAD superfamily)
MDLEILANKKGFLCDMDGVIIRGNSVINGAREFIDKCKQKDKKLLFVTNSSKATKKELQQKFSRFVRIIIRKKNHFVQKKKKLFQINQIINPFFLKFSKIFLF